MNQKTNAFPSRKAWKSYLQTLYNMRIGASATRLKNYHVSDFKMALIDPELVEEPHSFFYEAMNQLLNHPLLDEESLNYEKKALLDEFTTKKSSKNYRASRILIDDLFKDHPYLIRTDGEEDRIEKVTLDMIMKAYQSLLSAPVLMVVVGPLELESIQTLIDALKLNPKKRFKNPELIKRKVPLLNLKPVDNEMKQLLVYDVFETGIYPDEPAHLALDLMTFMLGGDSESLLFKTIRETHSMAYSVSAMLLDDFGTMMIIGAIDPSKKPMYHEELLKMIDRLKNGDFDEKELEQVKKSRMEEIKRNTDSKGVLAVRALNHFLQNYPFEVNALIEPFKNVTKEDLILISQTLTHRGTFLFGATDA